MIILYIAPAAPQPENGMDPSAPITKKGILTSFRTGKSMNIPDSDVVMLFQNPAPCAKYKYSTFNFYSLVDAGLYQNLKNSTV